MDLLVPLQRGRLGEVLAADVAAEGLVARVAHAVAQQALGVGERLCAHLQHKRELRIGHIYDAFTSF